MTKQDFIFSEMRKHRLARHITFWAVWCLVYFLFFHLPLHAVFGWNLNETNANLSENGAWWILKMLVVNVFLAVVIPQMLFTYTLLYYMVPRYFYQKRNHIVTVMVIMAFIGAYLFVSSFFKQIVLWFQYLIGAKPNSEWPFSRIFFTALRDTLTALPIIAGLALLIKLMKRWWFKEKETQQIAEEKIKAELQSLKAQVHPHFLFNTLNNIYFFSISGSPKAPIMIKKLSDMLNYILNECNEQWVPLEKEIKMIEDYLSLEKIRYGDQMDLSVELPNNMISEHKEGREWFIAPLLLIPFVENSFKHGASKMLTQSHIRLRISIESDALHFYITNRCPPVKELNSNNSYTNGASGHVGLKNVIKRLQLLYPGTHELTVIPEPENFTVYLNLKLYNGSTSIQERIETKTEIAYDRA